MPADVPSILTAPQPVLTTPALEVDFEDGTSRVAELVTQMFEAMREANGLGLAAPQIGVGLAVFVFDDKQGSQGAVVNPRVVPHRQHGRKQLLEGCLSLPKERYRAKRWKAVALSGYDFLGNEVLVSRATGLLAQIFQHEVDHLNGRLLVDVGIRV